jgi:phasin family protein
MANPRQEERSTQNMGDAARQTGERTAEQASRIAQSAAEQTARMGQATAQAGEEVARVGASLLKQNAETFQKTWRFGLDMTSAMMGRSTEQISRTLGLTGDEAQEATERSARNAQSIIYSATAAGNVMTGLSQEYFVLVRHQIEHGMERMNDLWNCRTPQDLAAVQTDLFRDAVGSVLESSRRMADMSVKLAEDATKRMEETTRRAA